MIRRTLATLYLLTVAAPAAADCDVAARYNFAFAGQAAATLAYGTTYTYSAAAGSGDARSFTMVMAQNGLTSTTVNGTTLPAISALVTGADATKLDLVLGGIFSGRTADIAGNTRVVTVTFTFAQPVRDFTTRFHDIDFTTNQFRDIMMVSGTSAAGSYVPALITPFGNGNGSAPRTATSSSVTSGNATAPVNVTSSQAVGSGAADNNSDTGTLTASFAQPVTSVTLRYGNAPLTTGELTTGQQAVGIEGVSFCPMPTVTVTKTSTPVADANGAFNLPGSDVIYSLSVTNAGGSPVDASTIVLTDALPPGVTFRNLAFDGSTTLPATISGAANITLPGSGITYASADQGPYTLAPTTGYDPAVRAIRFTPVGQLATNDSFTIRFKARIK
ncbi:hypothetical protein M9980_11025 [Sphingomonas donggukensis]|uniref:DUF11 domain-containing protein n=1 Tax=Sphingomonas donggukensis TaxID=2949093 RepID=A0ABY4TXQ1_9SPHN|nr:hypothetical protein [Sphingomonas donggukensis]URW75088.1 hypothetical protein M9980_11025 [Sphingomonas donggukensis]